MRPKCGAKTKLNMEKDNLDTSKHIYSVLQLKQPMIIPIPAIHIPVVTIPNDINNK